MERDGFLDWLRRQHSFAYPGPGIPVQISDSRKEWLDDYPDLAGDPFIALDSGLYGIGNELKDLVPSLAGTRIEFGTVSVKRFDARTFRRKNGDVAIVLNQSVPLLLSKLTKLRIAADDPRAVTHCNRADPVSLSSEDYARMAEEVMEEYQRSFEIRGPYLELVEEMDVVRGMALMSAEAFLIGHELAHLMIDKKAEAQDDATREILADMIGADLMWQFVEANAQLLNAIIPLTLGLFRLFEVAGLHAAKAGKYTAPADRARTVLSVRLGEDFAEDLIQAEYGEGPWYARR